MATPNLDESDPPSRQESVVGSETGYRLDEDPDRYRDFSQSTEETGLLGAGTHDEGDDDTGRIPNGNPALPDDQDFSHLPPWRRPSVCRWHSCLKTQCSQGALCSQRLGLVAARPIRSLHPRFWGFNRPEVEPVRRSLTLIV